MPAFSFTQTHAEGTATDFIAFSVTKKKQIPSVGEVIPCQGEEKLSS